MDAILRCLQELGCTVERDAGGGLWTWICGERGRLCLRVVPGRGGTAVVHVLAPLRVPVERRQAVEALLAHLSDAEATCLFELCDDGEVRCANVLKAGKIRRMRENVFAAVRAMDSHLCRIEAVAGGLDPEQFIRH
jgi:hypothetical protein